MPRTWKFHIVKNPIETEKKFKWVLAADGKRLIDSREGFANKDDVRKAVQTEKDAIQKADVVED